MNDRGIEPVLSWKLGRRGPVTKRDHPAAKQLFKQRKHLVIEHGLLYRKLNQKGIGQPISQFVLPVRFRKRALEACHDEFGHQGMDKTTLLLQKSFFWNNLVHETREHIRNCSRCLSFKTPEETANIERIECLYPLEMIHLDFLSIGQAGVDEAGRKKKPINVLVVTDHFTRFSQAYVTTNQTAAEIAHKLWDKFISQFGWPEKILTDQGQGFESALFEALCKVSGIKKLRTCPYRPQGNEQVERFNKTLLNMIGTINPEEKLDWTTKVQTLTHAYNCTSSQTTGYSPFYLFYGRDPRIPIDMEFGLPEPQTKETLPEFVRQLKKMLSQAFSLAKETSSEQMGRHKRYFNQKHKCMKVELGDLVMLRIKAFGRDHKIGDKWETVPYRIVGQNGRKPVFMVQSIKETGNKNVKTIHRNMLFPISTNQCDNLLEQSSRISALAKSNILMAEHFNEI